MAWVVVIGTVVAVAMGLARPGNPTDLSERAGKDRSQLTARNPGHTRAVTEPGPLQALKLSRRVQRKPCSARTALSAPSTRLSLPPGPGRDLTATYSGASTRPRSCTSSRKLPPNRSKASIVDSSTPAICDVAMPRRPSARTYRVVLPLRT
jgi:hypothetical protein